MMEVIRTLEDIFNFKIIQHEPLSGGSISQVYKLKTNQGDLVLKLNTSDKIDLFLAEEVGLKTLRNTQSFIIPEVLGIGTIRGFTYILMEFIPSRRANFTTFKEFGENLAQLHAHHATKFGFESDNWVGTLTQINQPETSWSQFYWKHRILPQYQLAVHQNLISKDEIPEEKDFIQVIENEFSKTKPSLIHGDLWNGNYIINAEGEIALIDPAIYYGHPMMDIGMAKLFGGFEKDFFEAYRENTDDTSNWGTQIELAQYYYLLIHLNIFGRSYLPQVQHIKEKYFNG
ncbi:fructosamine kinase family protein [Weeksellaceae bacterium KMM 9713]|uniref:Fructosamine kinase family protein n=1 Tax=Profundicola chukchiensis TaxID=2961959 RepID=A0A9X4MZM2_9FLAO|nr:fructosamine kinase family protein [Profundicola chukchiensis]MDG4945785.1 fructosamine kinase family protein [Profundicola chukchiensis]